MIKASMRLILMLLCISLHAAANSLDETLIRMHQLNHSLAKLETLLQQVPNLFAGRPVQMPAAREEFYGLANDLVEGKHDIIPFFACDEELVTAQHEISKAEHMLNELECVLEVCLNDLLVPSPIDDDRWKTTVSSVLSTIAADEANTHTGMHYVQDALKRSVDEYSAHVEQIKSLSRDSFTGLTDMCKAYQDNYSHYLGDYDAAFERVLKAYWQHYENRYDALCSEFEGVVRKLVERFKSTLVMAGGMTDTYKQVTANVLQQSVESVDDMLNWITERIENICMPQRYMAGIEAKFLLPDDIYKSFNFPQQEGLLADLCGRATVCESIFLAKITQGFARCLTVLQDSMQAVLAQFIAQDEECAAKTETLFAHMELVENALMHELSVQIADVVAQHKSNTQQLIERLYTDVEDARTTAGTLVQNMRNTLNIQRETNTQNEATRVELCASIAEARNILSKALVNQQKAFEQRVANLDSLAAASQLAIAQAGSSLHVNAQNIFTMLTERHATFIQRVNQGMADFNCEMAVLDDALCAKITCAQATLVKAADSAAVKAIQQLDDLRFNLIQVQEDATSVISEMTGIYTLSGLITKIHTNIYPQLVLLRMLYCQCIPLPPPVPVP